jgi:hypothetical protein
LSGQCTPEIFILSLRSCDKAWTANGSIPSVLPENVFETGLIALASEFFFCPHQILKHGGTRVGNGLAHLQRKLRLVLPSFGGFLAFRSLAP